MRICFDDLDGEADKIYNFLHKWAFKIDRVMFEEALETMKQCIKTHNKGEQRRQGWFFMMLLQKMDRFKDWKIAQEMELDFESKNRKH